MQERSTELAWTDDDGNILWVLGNCMTDSTATTSNRNMQASIRFYSIWVDYYISTSHNIPKESSRLPFLSIDACSSSPQCMTLVLTGVISHHLVVIISIKTQKSEIVLMIPDHRTPRMKMSSWVVDSLVFSWLVLCDGWGPHIQHSEFALRAMI